jgi:AcrR family transcriptional regulator
MAESSRDRLIEVSSHMFYRDGFHAVGLDRILDQVNVTKTTFYNHFESKEALILAVLQRHDRWWRNEFCRLLRERAGDDPGDQLRAVPDVLSALFDSDHFNGCIFVNVAAEFPMQHDPVHIAAKEHKHLMELMLRDMALRAGASDPIALAEQLSMIMEGAYVTSQITGNPRTAEIAQRNAQMIFDRYLPVASR